MGIFTLVAVKNAPIKPDFEKAKAHRVQAEEVESRLESMTTEQYSRLDIIEHCPRILIEGGAGTGKTFIAGYVANRQAFSNQRVLLLCKVFIQRLVDQRQGGDFALSGRATGSRFDRKSLRQEVAWGKPGNLVWFKIIEISLRVFVFV